MCLPRIFRTLIFRSFKLPLLLRFGGISSCLCVAILAQGQLPYMNAGPNSVFAQIDFAQMYKTKQLPAMSEIDPRRILPDSGSVSALDLEAPNKASQQFNHGVSLMKAKNSKEALKYFEKAIAIYPDYVSAHNALGIAYLDQQDPRAKNEFETAARLDEKLPGPYLNLGVLALSTGDFHGADSNLEKAAGLTPSDPRILTALAFVQNEEHKYAESMQTVQRVHALNHHGIANVHYIAASSAISLHDFAAAKRELKTFLDEDPTNPLSPIARANLDALANRSGQDGNSGLSASHQLKIAVVESATPNYRIETFPNSPYLQAELSAAKDELDAADCDPCSSHDEPSPPRPETDNRADSWLGPAFATWDGLFTIHQAVDETALFFSVSQHGHHVNDLSLGDIEIRDDDKPPQRILQFTQQSRLPLRLGLLIDTSDSVEKRFQFEKLASERFIEQVLTGPSDLAFVAGFNGVVSVTQDFTRDPGSLANGVERLTNSGQTALFDAVSFACWKLAAYPDEGRVARVLVVLTDGEDNSSAKSLKRAIEVAEAAGVAVYTLSTSASSGRPPYDTDADRVLKGLAQGTGGDAVFPARLRSLDQYLAKLPDVIRSRYMIAYRPAGFVPNGKYRTVQLSVEKNGKHVRVHVRPGYYARLAANQR